MSIASFPLRLSALLFISGLFLLAPATPVNAAPEEASKFTVGFVYVGTKDDYGYNQAHALAAAAMKKKPGINVIEAETVPETNACVQVMESMINEGGAKVIFATSYGYFTHLKQLAIKYPKVMFLHSGGVLRDGDPPNVGTYYAYIDEVEYLCGMAAGAATKTGKLGYVAAKPIVPLLRDINAFTLGARSVNPNCTVKVVFTGDWFLPDKEADAVNLLADGGIDVVTCHVDSPKIVIETAEKRGIYSCGYHANGAALAPRGYLTGAEWNWGPLYERLVESAKANGFPPHNFMGSLRDESVKLSPFGPAVTPEIQTKIAAVKAEMVAGKFRIFKGPLKDYRGHIVIKEGDGFDDQDGALWQMNYFVEGIVGDFDRK